MVLTYENHEHLWVTLYDAIEKRDRRRCWKCGLFEDELE